MQSLDRRAMLLGIAAAGAAVGGSIPAARAAAPKTGKQAPGFYRYKVGDLEVTVVTDGARSFALTPDYVVNAPIADVRQALLEARLPADQMTHHYAPIVINTGSRLIVIDTGSVGLRVLSSAARALHAAIRRWSPPRRTSGTRRPRHTRGRVYCGCSSPAIEKDVVLETAAERPLSRSTEVDNPSSLVVRFGADQPLKLEGGQELAPFQIAYQTYGTLNAQLGKDNKQTGRDTGQRQQGAGALSAQLLSTERHRHRRPGGCPKIGERNPRPPSAGRLRWKPGQGERHQRKVTRVSRPST